MYICISLVALKVADTTDFCNHACRILVSVCATQIPLDSKTVCSNKYNPVISRNSAEIRNIDMFLHLPIGCT